MVLGPHHAWRPAPDATPLAAEPERGRHLVHESRPQSIDRIVLLGYMCSGKSTVGELLARSLGWRYIDFDQEIERRERSPVAAIIEQEGEEYFRGLEEALTREVASQHEIVVSPGGGWILQPELLEALGPGTLSVWLQVSPAETVRRLLDDPNPRPFQDHPDPIVPVTGMIEEREPLFRRADIAVPTDALTPPEVADTIEGFVRGRR
jgi:shikimate kinase